MSSEQPTLFEGKYEVIGKIAEGGMGAVYKVRHVLLNEVRIIKVMRAQAAEKEEHRKRFLREAQMATKLRHPSIVTFYDFAIDDTDTSYMVMEFIDGVTFNQVVRGTGPVPPAIAIILAKQCLSALGYLHRRSIVHRDVAPDNIMLTRDDEAGAQSKLIDLGIAKAVQEESLTVGAAFLGKLRYCSPEQLDMGTALDGRSDLFSFGIVFSEMLTGVCPMPGDSAQSILMAHVNGKFLPFTHTDPDGRVPPSLRTVVDKALQIDRSARIASADDFIRLLEDVERQEAMRATPQQLREFADRAIAKRPASPVKPASGAVSPLDAMLLPSTVKTSAPTAPQSRAATPRSQVEKTELWEPERQATPVPPPAPQPPRRRVWPWLLAPVVVVAVVAAYWLLHSSRSAPEGSASNVPQTASLAAPTMPPPTAEPPAPTAAPTRELPPTAVPAVAIEPTTVAVPTPRPKNRRVEPTPTHPVRVAEAAPPARKVPRALAHFCATVEPTAYAQAKASEKPTKWDSGGAEVFRAARPDADRIKIRIEVTPSQPTEGEPFQVTARLINGGDQGITVAKVEESAPAERGGFRAVGGVAVPATSQVGSELTLFRAEVTLQEGDAYNKEIRITSHVGDTWRTSVRVGTCPE